MRCVVAKNYADSQCFCENGVLVNLKGSSKNRDLRNLKVLVIKIFHAVFHAAIFIFSGLLGHSEKANNP